MNYNMKKIKINYHFWWRVLPFVGLVVWGTLCITRQLWYDEAYSASMISHSWFDLAMITAKCQTANYNRV